MLTLSWQRKVSRCNFWSVAKVCYCLLYLTWTVIILWVLVSGLHGAAQNAGKMAECHTEAPYWPFWPKEIIVKENKWKTLMLGPKTFVITGMKMKTTVQNKTMTISHLTVHQYYCKISLVFVSANLFCTIVMWAIENPKFIYFCHFYSRCCHCAAPNYLWHHVLTVFPCRLGSGLESCL